MFRKLHNGKRAGGDAWHSAVAGDRATTRFLFAALATSCLLAVSGCRQQAAENVVAGIRAARAKGEAITTKVEKILDETAAVRAAIRRAAPGDLVVCCVDDAVGVYRLANELLGAPGGGATAISDPGELDAPAG